MIRIYQITKSGGKKAAKAAPEPKTPKKAADKAKKKTEPELPMNPAPENKTDE